MSERERKSLDEALYQWRTMCLKRYYDRFGITSVVYLKQVDAHLYLLTEADHAN